MDEPDSIAEDLDVQPQNPCGSGPDSVSVQRVLSKVPTGLSGKSVRLRNKSVGLVAEEIPRMIDQQRHEEYLRHVLVRILTQSQRMSGLAPVLSDVDDIPPDVIREWLEVAQSELSSTINSITTLLETFPDVNFEPPCKELDEQPEYEHECGHALKPEVGYDQDPKAIHEVYSPSQRSYAESLAELQDRVAVLERLLRRQSDQSTRVPTEPTPSRVEDVGNDELIISRIATRQPTRRPTEPMAALAEDVSFEAPALHIRKGSTVPPPPTPGPKVVDQEPEVRERNLTALRDPSPEPIMHKGATRPLTECISSPEPTIRKASTRYMTDRLPSSASMVPEPPASTPELEIMDEVVELKASQLCGLERRKRRASSEVDNHVLPVVTVPAIPIERDRKFSNAAPGIMAPPPELVQRNGRPTEPKKKPHKKTPNYPPEKQYPPAPAYPARNTPAWTKPDTHTPPPRPKDEPAPKKRGFFRLGSKPKAEPRRSTPESYHGPEPQVGRSHCERPFRYAAPGPISRPGGAHQRPKGYSIADSAPARRAPAPISVRRDGYQPRAALVYARKDDHYPRLEPIVHHRRGNYPQTDPAHARRDVHPSL